MFTFKPRLDMLGTADVVEDRGNANREPEEGAGGGGLNPEEVVGAMSNGTEDAEVVAVVAVVPVAAVESVPVGLSPVVSNRTMGLIAVLDVNDANRGRIRSSWGRFRLKEGRCWRWSDMDDDKEVSCDGIEKCEFACSEDGKAEPVKHSTIGLWTLWQDCSGTYQMEGV